MTTVRVDPDIVQVQKEWEDSIIHHPLLQKETTNKDLQNTDDFKLIQFRDKDFDLDSQISKWDRFIKYRNLFISLAPLLQISSENTSIRLQSVQLRAYGLLVANEVIYRLNIIDTYVSSPHTTFAAICRRANILSSRSP